MPYEIRWATGESDWNFITIFFIKSFYAVYNKSVVIISVKLKIEGMMITSTN